MHQLSARFPLTDQKTHIGYYCRAAVAVERPSTASYVTGTSWQEKCSKHDSTEENLQNLLLLSQVGMEVHRAEVTDSRPPSSSVPRQRSSTKPCGPKAHKAQGSGLTRAAEGGRDREMTPPRHLWTPSLGQLPRPLSFSFLGGGQGSA